MTEPDALLVVVGYGPVGMVLSILPGRDIRRW